MKLEAWEIKDFAPGEGSYEKAMSHAVDRPWIAVKAPCDTYMALNAAALLPHPFNDENEAACAWVSEREWWWRTTFAAAAVEAAERLMLVFEGLDTFATIWLNGELIGESSNMFRSVSFDVTHRLLADASNSLIIRFTPPTVALAEAEALDWLAAPGKITQSKRNLMRKAQFGWGWDWGPRLPTVGVWRPVGLCRQKHAVLSDAHFSTLDVTGPARVRIAVAVDAFQVDEPVSAQIDIFDIDGVLVASDRLAVSRQASTELTIEQPQLWWTPELGSQPLYDLQVTLRHGEVVIDSRCLAVGIRTLTLDRSMDPSEKDAEFFRFVLNGVPIFARGINWIPASSFIADVQESEYASLLQNAADANMNMVRVWGGGVYEHEAFYEQCDRLGLLVWQDFMFACAPYPQAEATFMESIADEVRYQVGRLRSHPSLALWCGNNENQVIQQLFNHLAGSDTPLEGAAIFDRLLPDLLRKLDAVTPYWPGSPYGGVLANSMKAGDVHNWTVWHGMPTIPDDQWIGSIDTSPEGVAYTRYAEDMSRFSSEYGIQAAPALSTLSRWMTADTLALASDGFLHRIKDEPKNKVDAMLLPVTGLPTTLQQYVSFTQITQAEGLKFAIEHYRRRKPHCSGSLIWQYNDCWPGISWSLIDFDGVGKAGYFFVKRAYAYVLGSFKALDDGSVELWVTNDTQASMTLEADVRLSTLGGESLWGDTITEAIQPNSSRSIWRSDVRRLGEGLDRVLTVSSPDFPDNRHFFGAIKDLPWPTGELAMHITRRDEHTLEVSITGSCYHYFVHLIEPHQDTRFSDNYFDLGAGEVRQIIVSNKTAMLDPNELSVRSFKT